MLDVSTARAAVNVQRTLVPWGAWRGDAPHELFFPAGWRIDELSPPALPEWSDAQLAAALDQPVGCAPLAALAAGRSSVAIAVDDLSRPTPAARLLPLLLARLERAGIPPSRVSIVVATGAHGPVSPAGLQAKLGDDVVRQCRVECHDPHGALVDTGLLYGSQTLRINAAFAAAELKLALGGVLPHPFAGYSGGAKLILPGLTDLEATARAHKFVQLGLRGGHDPDRNRFRLEAEQIARQLGLAFVVCAAMGTKRQIVSLSAGDVAAAHRQAVLAAQHAGRTPVGGAYDALVLNAYPKDINLVQAEAALVALRCMPALPLSPQGVVVLTAAASEGVGRHDLFAPGGCAARTPAPLRALAGRALWVYSPGVTAAQVQTLFAAEYRSFGDPHALHNALAERFGPGASVGVVPAASMQELVAVESGAVAT